MYATLRSEFIEEWNKRKESQRKIKGGPDWYMMVPKRAGYAMTRRAIGAFAEGRITGTDLSELLNSKIHRIEDIATHADIPWTEWGKKQ